VVSFGVSARGAGAASSARTGSFGIAGEILGEKGGVRGRGAGAAGTGVSDRCCGAAAWGAGGRGDGVAARGSARGTGGGHAACDGVAAAGAGVLDRIGFTPRGVPLAAPLPAGATAGRSSPQLTAAPTGMRPPHTEQRARIEMLVIFAGSRRKTERHSGQDTFIENANLVESGIRRGVAPE
jgi:hypothetical protein